MEKKPSSLGGIVVTAAITALFTIASSLALYYLTQQKATLKYEILPISTFNKDSLHLSIVNVRILNDGDKESEDVRFAVSFNDNKPSDISFEKSSPTIEINIIGDSASHRQYYSIPFINPKEQILCSFLLDKVVNKNDVIIDLRSRGINGVAVTTGPDTISNLLFLSTLGMLFLTIGLIMYIISYQRRVIRYQRQLAHLHSIEYEKVLQKLRENNIDLEKG